MDAMTTTLQRRIPPTLTIRSLKNLIARSFKDAHHPLAQMMLFLRSKSRDADAYIFIEMDHELREVGFYGVESGDTVIVTFSSNVADVIRETTKQGYILGGILRD